jgi:hypothetical protein
MRRIPPSVEHHSRSSIVRGNRPAVNSRPDTTRPSRLSVWSLQVAGEKQQEEDRARHQQRAEPYWNVNTKRALGWTSGQRLGAVEKLYANSLPRRASPAARCRLRLRLRRAFGELMRHERMLSPEERWREGCRAPYSFLRGGEPGAAQLPRIAYLGASRHAAHKLAWQNPRKIGSSGPFRGLLSPRRGHH